MLQHTILLAMSVLYTTLAIAQKDTTPNINQAIKVKASFKPVLIPATKLSFTATPPVIDTTPPKLSYTVPSQNLFFSYIPFPLKPVALDDAKVKGWANSNYIKIGYGNYNTPYLQAGLSFGNSQTASVGAYAHYISSKGSLPNQAFTQYGVGLQGTKLIQQSKELNSSISYNHNGTFLYGYNRDTISYTKDQVRQQFNTISLSTNLRNTTITEYGINYNPSISASIFTDNRKANETTIGIKIPIEKNIGQTIGVQLGASLDYVQYKKPSVSITNTILNVSPALLVKNSAYQLKLGATPTWDNGKLTVLPNITANAQLQQSKLVLQLGWLGYYNIGSYQQWAQRNPFIIQPNALPNTKVNEAYIGFKGTSGSHIVYNLKASYVGYLNMPLFTNDSITAKSFIILNEPNLKTIQFVAEVGVIEKEIFHFTAGIKVNNFISLATNAKAWGMLPLELTGALRWQLAKGVTLTSDAFVWDGATFKTKTGTTKLKVVADINVGAQFKIAKNIAIWAAANNISNNTYQRWRNYETLGANYLGGIRYTFDTRKQELLK